MMISQRSEPISLNIDLLLHQRKLLRILQPSLRQQIEEAIRLEPALKSYILQHQAEIYLSLESIGDPQQRTQLYDIIQGYQIDANVDLRKLPTGLRACLQPQKQRQGRLIGALAVGLVAGILLGLMGIAVGVLATAVFGLGNESTSAMVPVATFITCYALGWAAVTYYLWHTHPLGFWRRSR